MIEGWEQAIARLKARYIKIDATELWSMVVGLEEEEYEANLRGGVRWFDTGSDTDFEQLLGLLWRQDAYDRATRAFKDKSDVPFMFYGLRSGCPPWRKLNRACNGYVLAFWALGWKVVNWIWQFRKGLSWSSACVQPFRLMLILGVNRMP